MPRVETIQYYLNSFSYLVKSINDIKTRKKIFGFLVIIAIIIFYFRKADLVFDIINSISLFVLASYIFDTCLSFYLLYKFDKEIDTFVKSGLLDECDENQKAAYNSFVNEFNEFVTKKKS